MSKRLLNSQSSDRSGGRLLMSELENLGRTRGSSATPVQPGPSMLSPQPQRDLQAPIDKLNDDMRHTSFSQGKQTQIMIRPNRVGSQIQHKGVHHQRGQSSSTLSQNYGVKYENHARDTSSSTQQSNSSAGPGTFKFPTTQGPSNPGNPTPMTISELSQQFQTKLMEVQSMISRRTDIPAQIQDVLIDEVRKIAREFNDAQRRVQLEFDSIKNERDDLRRQLQAARVDNNRYVQERKTLELKHQRSSERMQEVESRWKRVQEGLLEQIAVQKEQLAGKRALWMDANPGSSARRTAMTTTISDPFNSPTAKQKPSYPESVMGSMLSPSVTSPPQSSFGSGHLGPPPPFNNILGAYNTGVYTVAGYKAGTQFAGGFGTSYDVGSSSRNRSPRANPQSGRRTGTLPVGVPLASAFMPAPPPAPLTSVYGSIRPFTTEPGSPKGVPPTALVLHKGHEQLATEYKAAISKLYDLVEDWVLKYANEPCQKNDRAIASSNDILWDYMMNCTYPGHRQDAHTHVVALLSESNTRYWFVMRMATQYCVKDIMSIEAFKPYSTSVETIITEMLLKLQERGLNNEARQQYIDRGSAAVQSVVAARDYQSFRAQQLNFHTKALRDILGPMLNDGAVRSEAGKDLGAIAVHSWELSVKMHTAGLTFQIYFPETASKFTAATMKAKDRLNADPMQLQVQQVRLKLVITPVITMRDDKGTTIKAKAIHSSNVLLMS